MKQAYLTIIIITVLILIYKTVLYKRSFPSKRMICWLYFGRNEVILSSNNSRRTAKEQQNILSIIALIGLILAVCLYLLIP